MLILSRKIGEKIRIGPAGEITLVVLDVLRNGRGVAYAVKLGVEAPREVEIRRPEWVPKDGPTAHTKEATE